MGYQEAPQQWPNWVPGCTERHWRKETSSYALGFSDSWGHRVCWKPVIWIMKTKNQAEPCLWTEFMNLWTLLKSDFGIITVLITALDPQATIWVPKVFGRRTTIVCLAQAYNPIPQRDIVFPVESVWDLTGVYYSSCWKPDKWHARLRGC